MNFPAFLNPLNWIWPVATEVSDPGTQKPNDAETTGRQDLYPWGFAVGQFGLPWGSGGYSAAPQASLLTYRMMEHWPTLGLAYSIARAPILAAPYSVEADEEAEDEWRELIEKEFPPHLPKLLRAMFRATCMRFAPFEVPYILKDGYQVPEFFKPLLPEATQILITPNGKFAGLRQAADILGANAFCYVNEPDRIPIYGHSRCENVRENAWWPWLETMQQGGKLDKKAAGIIVDVGFPVSLDAAGQEDKVYPLNGKMVGGSVAALDLAAKLTQGISVAHPQYMFMAKGNVNADYLDKLSKLSAFPINLLDLGNVGPANEAILKKLQYYDALGFRGFYLPERSALEAAHGRGGAESEVMGGFVTVDAERQREDLANAINEGPIDDCLRLNFGEQAVGKVRLTPAPLKDNRLAILSTLVDGMVKNGMAGPVAEHTNMKMVYELLGIPPVEDESVDWDGKDAWAAPEPVANPGNPNQPPGKQPPNGRNGNGKLAKQLARVGRFLGGE